MTARHRVEDETLDSQMVLRLYAVSIGLAGFFLAGWGQIWLGSHLAEVPWGLAALIRVGGSVMVAAAVLAVGVASVDSHARLRLLSWFIGAHLVVWAMLATQSYGTLDIQILRHASWALLAVILVLLVARFDRTIATRGPLSITRPEPAPSRVQPEAWEIREAAAQEERNRLARELHDAVKQQVFAIQTSAATAEARFDPDPSGARHALTQIRQSAREAMSEMEALLEQLRAAPLGTTGLVEAIRKQCEALAFRTGANVDVRIGTLPPDEAFAPGTHQAIYRVAQEALANIGRHARARHVTVSLETTPLEVELRIEDDGVGFSSEGRPAGMGIHNMRARAEEIGARIEITPSAEGGTRVLLSVPYETADDRDYRRSHASKLALLYGALAFSGMFNLGRSPSWIVSVILFTLLFVQHLRSWLRLRRNSQASASTHSESTR